MGGNITAAIQWPSFQGQAALVGTSPSGRVTIYVDPTLGQPGQQNALDLLAMRVSALFEAELSECNMGGNLCGLSTGEALSRWCAASVSNNALGDFATAPTWFGDGAADFVSTTDPTDTSADSTGCGMAFISWLLSKNMSLDAIARGLVALGSGGTFAQLYGNLTGIDPNTAWTTFIGAVRSLGGVTSDDPFGAMPSVQTTLAAMRPVSHRLRPPAKQRP